jgi:YjbE family integral membrane protein
MELFSPEFFTALAAIILIDLVLAGDNAIVIALAARNLPPRLQRRAVLWGTAGAIAVRAAMTVAVVALLKIPGLMLAGGVLLLWIAYRLLAPEEKSSGAHAAAATGFWGAMRTIVIADAVMGLDNVLAVAGAAHGSYVLVILGLLISIPIVVWGSTLILRWIERFPAIVYVGAGVLAATAAKMVLGEPLVEERITPGLALEALVYAAFVGGVLGAGLARSHRRRALRVRDLASRRDAPAQPARRILIPVDGSRNALHAVRQVLRRASAEPLDVHLLNVQPPFSRHVAQFAARGAREAWHRAQAEKAIAPARALLARHGVPCSAHWQVGDRVAMIVAEAQRLGCERIVIATARRNSLTRVFDLSVTERVLDRSTLPVEVVTGDAVSPVERLGVPAGLAAVLAALLAADVA